jgi:polar amino acid transport system substrate-binding protein
MKKVLKAFAVVAVVLVLFAVTSCSNKQAGQQDSKTQAPGVVISKAVTKPASLPVLKVATVPDYKPFEYVDEMTNEITGFDVEFISAVADAAGMKVELKIIEKDSVYTSLNTGQADLVISAITITPERQIEVSFSEPYFEAQQRIATIQGSPYKDLKSLTDQIIGVQGNSPSQYALEKVSSISKDNIRPYATVPEALMGLTSGSLAAVVADGPSVLHYIYSNIGMKIVSYNANLGKEYYGIIVKKDNAPLLVKINAAIQAVKDSGKYAELYKKYFGN